MAETLGVTQSKDNKELASSDDYNEAFFSKNPLVGGLIELKNILQIEKNKNEDEIEVNIKL